MDHELGSRDDVIGAVNESSLNGKGSKPKCKSHLDDNRSGNFSDKVKSKGEMGGVLDHFDNRNKDKDEEVEITEDNDKGRKVQRCDPCLYDETETQAVAFCTICIDYLCKECVRDHKRSRMTRSHKVIEGDEMPDNPNAFKMMKSMMSCSDHPEIEVSFECKDHETYICTKCLAVNHRKCDEVIEVSKMLKVDDIKPAIKDILESIHGKTLFLRTAIEENIKSLQHDQNCICTEREEFLEKIHHHLLKLDENSKSETENLIADTQVVLEKEAEECKDMEHLAKKHLELLDITIKYGSPAQLNIISKLTLKQAELLQEFTKKHDKHTSVHLKFHENQSLTSLSSIGMTVLLKGKKDDPLYQNKEKEIIQESSSDFLNDMPEIKEDIVEAGKTRNSGRKNNPLMHSNVSRTRTTHDLSKQTPGSKSKCSFTSLLILSDGRIAVTDYNNETIKLLKPDFSVKEEYGLYGKPIDMCQTSGGIVAVLLENKKMVYRYDVTEDMVCNINGFHTKLYPISIGQSNETDHLVVILFSDKEIKTEIHSGKETFEVQVRSMVDGEIIKQLTEFKSRFSVSLIPKNLSRIRVMPQIKNAFLISEKNMLRCFDVDKAHANTLKEHWFYKSYKENIINDITDIAADKEGNLYLCGKGSRNIHQISGRNFMHNRVLLSVPGIPLSVCIDDERRLVIVGCENDDCIYVFAFE